MKKSTRNKLAMYKMVHDVLSANATSWEGIPAFVSTAQEFSAKVHLIEVKEQVQSSVSVGVGLVAKTGKADSSEKLLRYAAALKALASTTKNEKLFLEVKFGKSRIINKTKVDIMSLADLVIARVNEFAPELVNFGLTTDEIANVNSLHDELNTYLTSSRKAINTRKLTNKEIVELSREVDALLKERLDSLMLIIKTTDPVFYSNYVNARMVIDYGYRSGNTDAA